MSVSSIAPSCAFGQTPVPPRELVWSAASRSWLKPAELRAQFRDGDVLVLGEQHATKDNLSAQVHHANQLRLMQTLGVEHRISLGMEFFEYPRQSAVDRYLGGQLSEADFLAEIGWGGKLFSLYRPQVLEPLATGGKTLALNIPRSITGKISQQGPDSLDIQERQLLPPIWERGGDLYFARFEAAMGGHGTPEQLANYFWSQSLWDDTMAWRAFEHRQVVTDDLLMILVGEFHVEYGLGLPARLERYGVASVKTIVQVELTAWSDTALAAAVEADPVYGDRADYIWVYELPKVP